MQEENTTEYNSLEHRIKAKIAEIERLGDTLPGVVIIHNLLKGGAVEYMSPRGLRELGVSLEELKEMGEAYLERFFDPQDAQKYVPKILELVARNDESESFSFFQQVSIAPYSREFIWHMSSLKIFMRDDNGQPILAITFSAPIDPDHELTQKVSRLLDQNNFLRTHYQNFAKLGKREYEVLRLMALGKSTAEIAEELFIAVATVETHRKHIRKKLGIESAYDLAQYAQAFDLI